MAGRRVGADEQITAVAVIDDVDIDSLDVERRSGLLSSFARLIRITETPLCFHIERRAAVASLPIWSPSSPPQDQARPRPHRRALVSRILLSISLPTGRDDLLAAARTQIATCISAGTVRHRWLEGAELAMAGDPWGVPTAMWAEHRDHARVGDTLLRGHVMTRLPGAAVQAGWLRPLLSVDAACDILMRFEPIDTGVALSQLDRRLRDLRSDQLVAVESGRLSHTLTDHAVDSALALQGRLAANRSRPLLLSVGATAMGSTPDELERGSRAIRSAARSALIGMRPTHFEHRAVARACRPGADTSMVPRKLVDSTAAATCTPWLSTECSDPDGYRLGHATATGLPVTLAPFLESHHPNANILVMASSGQGKSYTVGAIVLAATEHGVESIVIDPEGEYRGVIEATGGRYVQIAPGSEVALNIFDIAAVRAGDSDDGDVTAAVVDLVGVLVGEALDGVERAAVDRAARIALQQAREHRRAAVLGDCLASLPPAGRPALVLERFCSGPLGSLFNRPTSVRLGAPTVGLCLRDLKRELIAPATFIIAEWLWALIRDQPRARHLVFDEVGLLAEHAALRTLLVQLARRCRKYRTSLVLATQNAGDLLRSDDGTVIATNPAIVLLGGHRGAEVGRMDAAYSLTSGQRRWLESAGRGEFLLLAGARRLCVGIEVSAAHHDILVRAR